MLRPIHILTNVVALSIGIAIASDTFAQSPPPTPAPATPPSPVASTPPPVAAKDIQGLDVFGSDGQQLGKIAKVNVIADGKVKDVEVQSGGFFGFFSTTYVVPVDKLNKKGGRVELSMTSEQAKRLNK